MYSVVTSTKRAPASTSRRASRQPRPKRPVSYLLETLLLLQRQIERAASLCELSSRWAVSIAAQHRLLLVIAGVLACGLSRDQLLVEPVAILEPAGVHALRRPHGQRRVFRDTAD